MARSKTAKKVFKKNSSLVTTGFNSLQANQLPCDELHFQLITEQHITYF